MSMSESFGEFMKNKILSGLLAAIFGLLTWNTYTTYQSSLKLSELSVVVDRMVVDNLSPRVTTLEALVARNLRDIEELQDGKK